MENTFKRMKRDYDENSVFLVGKVDKINDSYFDVAIDKDRFKIAITKEFESAVQQVKQKSSNGNVFVILWGLITNGDKFDYIYPMSMSFTSFSQPTRKVAYISGEILNVYDFENRYRLKINSKKKLNTRIFATLYKSKGIDATKELQGKKVLLSGYIYSHDNHIDFMIDEVFISRSNGTNGNVDRESSISVNTSLVQENADNEIVL